MNNTTEPLINYQSLGKLATLAHPTNDHYLPLMYTLGLRDKTDDLLFFNYSLELGSISIRSVLFNESVLSFDCSFFFKSNACANN